MSSCSLRGLKAETVARRRNAPRQRPRTRSSPPNLRPRPAAPNVGLPRTTAAALLPLTPRWTSLQPCSRRASARTRPSLRSACTTGEVRPSRRRSGSADSVRRSRAPRRRQPISSRQHHRADHLPRSLTLSALQPTRIVLWGFGELLEGATLLQKRDHAKQHLDHLRRRSVPQASLLACALNARRPHAADELALARSD